MFKFFLFLLLAKKVSKLLTHAVVEKKRDALIFN